MSDHAIPARAPVLLLLLLVTRVLAATATMRVTPGSFGNATDAIATSSFGNRHRVPAPETPRDQRHPLNALPLRPRAGGAEFVRQFPPSDSAAGVAAVRPPDTS